MMYIEPNTDIRLIRACPLDKNYENTIYFTNVAAQQNYFHVTLSGYNFTRQSYQRVKKGVLRIAKQAETMYDCNYLAFKNASFGSKWFYAFIDRIEYVNNVTSEIYYTIDVIQTWLFDFALMQCLVEREHTETDVIGEHLVPEGLDTGDYISDSYYMPNDLNSYSIVFWCTFVKDPVSGDWENVGGSVTTQGYQDNYSGLTPTIFPLTEQGIEDAISWLGSVPTLKQSGIVTACIAPSIFTNALERTVTITKSSAIQRTDNHSIKNNKLYTYPYNFLYVTNGEGQSTVYRYEYFSTQQCIFGIFADTSPKTECILYPKNYKGILGDNFDERIGIKNYPQVGYNLDTFKAWLAQSLSSIGTAAALIGSQMDIGVMTEVPSTQALAPYGAAGGLYDYALPTQHFDIGLAEGGGLATAIPIAMLAKLALDGVAHAYMPPQAKGQQGGSVSLARGILNFGFMKKHIRDEFVTIIDDYFNMYGYKINKVKVPNYSSRPEWNYTKTVGCKIIGDIPADDTVAIEKIFDNGIRFWKYPAHIGNYSYDNSPSS